jgi:hypothetical protein
MACGQTGFRGLNHPEDKSGKVYKKCGGIVGNTGHMISSNVRVKTASFMEMFRNFSNCFYVVFTWILKNVSDFSKINKNVIYLLIF